MKLLFLLFFLTYAAGLFGQQSIFQKDTVHFSLYEIRNNDGNLQLAKDLKPGLLPYAASFFIDKDTFLHASYELRYIDIPHELIEQKTMIDRSKEGLVNRYLYKYFPLRLSNDLLEGKGNYYLQRKDEFYDFSIAYLSSENTKYLRGLLSGGIAVNKDFSYYLDGSFHHTHNENASIITDTVLFLHHQKVDCYIYQWKVGEKSNIRSTRSAHFPSYNFLSIFVEKSTMLPVYAKVRIINDYSSMKLTLYTEYFLIPEGLDVKL